MTALRLDLLREERRNPLFANAHPRAASRAHLLSATQLRDARQLVLLALSGPAAIGVLRCVVTPGSVLARPSRYAMVTTVYVHPVWRRRGVLRALLRTADRWARSRGLTEMRLTCALTNTTGLAAWQALGFVPAELLYRRIVPRR